MTTTQAANNLLELMENAKRDPQWLSGPRESAMDMRFGCIGNLPTPPEEKVLYKNCLYEPNKHRVLVLYNADDLLESYGYKRGLEDENL